MTAVLLFSCFFIELLLGVVTVVAYAAALSQRPAHGGEGSRGLWLTFLTYRLDRSGFGGDALWICRWLLFN